MLSFWRLHLAVTEKHLRHTYSNVHLQCAMAPGELNKDLFKTSAAAGSRLFPLNRTYFQLQVVGGGGEQAECIIHFLRWAIVRTPSCVVTWSLKTPSSLITAHTHTHTYIYVHFTQTCVERRAETHIYKEIPRTQSPRTREQEETATVELPWRIKHSGTIVLCSKLGITVLL